MFGFNPYGFSPLPAYNNFIVQPPIDYGVSNLGINQPYSAFAQQQFQQNQAAQQAQEAGLIQNQANMAATAANAQAAANQLSALTPHTFDQRNAGTGAVIPPHASGPIGGGGSAGGGGGGVDPGAAAGLGSSLGSGSGAAEAGAGAGAIGAPGGGLPELVGGGAGSAAGGSSDIAGGLGGGAAGGGLGGDMTGGLGSAGGAGGLPSPGQLVDRNSPTFRSTIEANAAAGMGLNPSIIQAMMGRMGGQRLNAFENRWGEMAPGGGLTKDVLLGSPAAQGEDVVGHPVAPGPTPTPTPTPTPPPAAGGGAPGDTRQFNIFQPEYYGGRAVQPGSQFYRNLQQGLQNQGQSPPAQPPINLGGFSGMPGTPGTGALPGGGSNYHPFLQGAFSPLSGTRNPGAMGRGR